MKGGIITSCEMLAIPAFEISDLDQIDSNPLVSVIIITYKHEAYIDQTIKGILAQQCDFPIEIIIGEDNSKDKTLSICLDYQKNYSEFIRVVTWHENVGPCANFLRIWGRARGKYVAICEGDDYWIDPAKLTKQVGLMDQFPDTSFCGARTIVLCEVPGKSPTNTVIGPARSGIKYSLFDVMTTYLCHTSTFMLRKSAIMFPEQMRSLTYLDGYIQSLSAIHGSIRCLSDVVSVYRQHQGGICTGSDSYLHYDHNIAVCEALLEIVNEQDARYVKIGIDLMQYKKCHHMVNNGKIHEARQMAPLLLKRLMAHDSLKALLLSLHVYLPKLYALMKTIKHHVGISEIFNRFVFNMKLFK